MTEETKVIYYIDEETTPYLVKVPVSPEKMTLGELKNALQNKTCYKYHFRSKDDDFGFVKEEISDEAAHLPHANGRIICWLTTIEGSHHSSEQSGVRPSRGGYVPPPNAIRLTDSNLLQNAAGSITNNAAYTQDSFAPRAHSNSHSSTSNVNLNSNQLATRRSLSQSGSATGTDPYPSNRMTADGERESAEAEGDGLSAEGAHDDQVAPLPQFGIRYPRHAPASYGNSTPLGGHSHLQLAAQPVGVPIGVPPGYDAGPGGSSMFSSDLDSTSFCDSADDSSRISSATGTMSWIQRRGHKRLRRRRPAISRASSLSSTTDSTMSLNIVTVTLNLDTCNFLGISIVGQSCAQGDGGIYVGSIMKGGAVDQDGRIEPGDMILEVNGVSFDCMPNDDAVRVLREAVSKPGPITLVVAKCWDTGPQRPKGYFTVPKQEPVRPIDPRAWVMHTQAHAGPPPSCDLSMLQSSPVVPPPSTFSLNAPSTHIDSVSQIDYQRQLAAAASASHAQRAGFMQRQADAQAAAMYQSGYYAPHGAGYPNYASGPPLGFNNPNAFVGYPYPAGPGMAGYPGFATGAQSAITGYTGTCASSTVPDSESAYTADEREVQLTAESDPFVIARALAQPDSGLEVRDRNWLKITIPNAFIGADLVDQLHTRVEGFSDRRQAKQFACRMLKEGYIKHTVNKSSFSEQCYYVFSERVLAAANVSQGQAQIGVGAVPMNTNETRETNLDEFESVSTAGQQRNKQNVPGPGPGPGRNWPVSAMQYAANASRFANPNAYQQYAARVPFAQGGQPPNMYGTDASSQLTLPAPSLAFGGGNELQAQADQRTPHNRLSGSFRPSDVNAVQQAQQNAGVSVQFAPTANTFQPPLTYEEKQQRSLANTGGTSVLSGGTSIAVENCACLHSTFKQFRSLWSDKDHAGKHRKKHGSRERELRQPNANNPGAYTSTGVQQTNITAQRQLRADALKVPQPAGAPAQPGYMSQYSTGSTPGSNRGPPQFNYGVSPQPSLFRPAAAGFAAPVDGQQLIMMSRIFGGGQPQVATTQLSAGTPSTGGTLNNTPSGIPNPRNPSDSVGANGNGAQLENGGDIASSTSTSGTDSGTDEGDAGESAAPRRGNDPPMTSRTHSNNESGSATNSHAEQNSLNGAHAIPMMAVLGNQCDQASLSSVNSSGLPTRLNANGHGLPIAAQAQI